MCSNIYVNKTFLWLLEKSFFLHLQFGNLAKLQAEVNGESIKNSRLLEERDDMLQRVSCEQPSDTLENIVVRLHLNHRY